ncbi:MAG: NAD/NADP octopine/nopaline dehydrogenase family protein [Dehalococcoidia bacterium]
MKVAVLGGGPGSIAMAGHLTTLGHDVRFWARNRTKLSWLMDSKRVRFTGALTETVELASATDDLAAVVEGSSVVFVPLPAPAHEDMAERLKPVARSGQLFLTSSMSGLGSVVLSRALGSTGALTAELPGLPYGARFEGDGVVNLPLIADISSSNVYGRGVGAFPSVTLPEVLEHLSGVYPGVYGAEDSLACAFQAWGPVLHPALMILNLTSIENFCFWDPHEEGTTPSVFRLVKALDMEREALQAAWGYRVTQTRVAKDYYEGHIKVYDTWPNFRDLMTRWAWKDRLDVSHRYLTEDAKFGMVLRLSAARVVGLEMPLTEAIVRIGGALNEEDFSRTGRTLESLGLVGDKRQVLDTLKNGWGEGS